MWVGIVNYLDVVLCNKKNIRIYKRLNLKIIKINSSTVLLIGFAAQCYIIEIVWKT